MTYEEMIARVKGMIERGEPLHGYVFDIAVEIAFAEMEDEK